jgi:hypothetical protein
MADIVESWLWRSPEEIIEPLLRRSDRQVEKAVKADVIRAPAVKDRYYTMARKLYVKQLRGRR